MRRAERALAGGGALLSLPLRLVRLLVRACASADTRGLGRASEPLLLSAMRNDELLAVLLEAEGGAKAKAARCCGMQSCPA